jgi:hypothetical protein
MLSLKEIQECVHEIRSSKMEEALKCEFYKNTYEEFYKECPKLFDAAMDQEFPLTYLNMMIEQIVMLNKKKTNTDSANETIFKALNDEYIEPLVRLKESSN